MFTGNVNYTTQLGNLVVLASFAYMSESTASIDGVEPAKPARYISNLTLNYQFDDRWAISLNGSWSYQEKNEINIAGFVVPEPKNSNSNVVIGSIEPSYQVTERLRLAANYSFLWRDQNYYDQFENQFIPAKTKHTVGLLASVCIFADRRYSIEGRLSVDPSGHQRVLAGDAGAAYVASIPPGLTYEAWTTSISANFRF